MSLLHMKIIKKKENKRKNRLMLNIEKYKDDILNAKQTDIHCSVHNILLQLSHIACTGNCRECEKNVMKWLLSEYKEPILDDVEREYLSAVIKPFRNKVKNIVKISGIGKSKEQYIRIILGELDFMNFPNFNKNTGMYKGMEADRLYSLEELGL